MRLARAGNEELVSLRIAEEPDHLVLFHQLVQSGSEFILVGAGLGLNRIGHRRFRHGDRFEKYLVPLGAERVAGERDAQLRHRAQIARMQLLHLHRLAPLHDGEVCHALCLAARKALHRRVGLQRAADDFEERDPAGKGIDHRLEDIQRERLLVFHAAHYHLDRHGSV